MQPGTRLTINCYQGTKLLWQVSKQNLSRLSRFILNSEQFRKDNLNGNATIIIRKVYDNFPEHNIDLEAFATNNSDLVQKIANDY